MSSLCLYLQHALQLTHQNEVLQNEIDLLKKQITFRDEFIEVSYCGGEGEREREREREREGENG